MTCFNKEANSLRRSYTTAAATSSLQVVQLDAVSSGSTLLQQQVYDSLLTSCNLCFCTVLLTRLDLPFRLVSPSSVIPLDYYGFDDMPTSGASYVAKEPERKSDS
jgi:hypothetical protein